MSKAKIHYIYIKKQPVNLGKGGLEQAHVQERKKFFGAVTPNFNPQSEN